MDKAVITDDELEYVFHVLNDRDILVVGDSPVLYEDFDNYKYVKRPVYKNQRDLYDAKKCDELIHRFKTMKTETEKEKLEYDFLRKKLVSMNVRFVDFIVNRLNHNGEFNSDELLSYGYEGLIIAVDNFNIDKGSFSEYAKKCIQGSIITGMRLLRGFPSARFYDKYKNAKKMVEEELGITIENEFKYLDEISTKIYLQDSKPLDTVEQIKSKISLINNLSLDEIEEEFYDDNTLYYAVIESLNLECLKKDIDKFLSKLTVREKEVMIEKYGLQDGKPKTDREVANNMGCRRQNVSEIEKRSLHKLKQEKDIVKLEEYYNSIGEYDYNPCGIETVKIKQKSK